MDDIYVANYVAMFIDYANYKHIIASYCCILIRCILLQINIMITIVTVWLCLITHIACDVVITINNNGSDNDKCCVNGTCPCSSLLSALHNVSDNTVINITSESVTLHDIVGMGSGNLNKITITGNGATIMCNNIGGVCCESCSDITIMGITWYQCGHNDSNHPITQIPALNFIKISSKLVIQNCTFLKSSGCPVCIESAKGTILITETNFLANFFDLAIADSANYDFFCAGLYISSNAQIVLTMNNSKFDSNGCMLNMSEVYICPAYGAVINSSNNVSEFNQFLFENTNFSNNSNGIYLNTCVENAVIESFNVNVCNSTVYGIYIVESGGTNDSVSNISLSFATFINNVCSLSITVDEKLVGLSVNMDNCAFSSISPNPMYTLYISSSASLTFVNVSNSFLCNSQDGSVIIQITSSSIKCITASILFTNVTIYNNTNSDLTDLVNILTENTIISVMFRNVNFMSNQFLGHDGGILVINNQLALFCLNIHPVFIQFTDCTFHKNTALDYVVTLNIINKVDSIFNSHTTMNIELFDCKLAYNFGGKSLVYINAPFSDYQWSVPKTSMILSNSTFSNSKGTVLHLIIPNFLFKSNSLFINNSAINGAAIYLEEVHTISFDDNVNIQFINNSAKQNGGAMYINLHVYLDQYCDVFKKISDKSNVSFSNNSAGIAGNSIYFNIPKSCQIVTDTNNKSSLLYYLNKFNYSQALSTINSPVVTSPYNIRLHPPIVAIHNSTNDYLVPESKMLGEPIQFNASVVDYFNNVTEPVTFSISCETCGDDYVLSTYQITVHRQSIYELKIFPTMHSDIISNTNILITFLSALSPVYKSINGSLSIKLSPCRVGYMFDKAHRQCICYPHSDLVHCKGDYVEIKIGYWIGYITQQHYTSSICPNNYCNTKYTESSPGYYDLSRKSDDQCSSHRTGVACGECKSGFTTSI